SISTRRDRDRLLHPRPRLGRIPADVCMPPRRQGRRPGPRGADPSELGRRGENTRRIAVDVLAGELPAPPACKQRAGPAARAGRHRRRAGPDRRSLGSPDQPRERRAGVFQPLRAACGDRRRRRISACTGTRTLSLLSGSRLFAENPPDQSLMHDPFDSAIPVLTDVVTDLDRAVPGYPTLTDALVAELQTRLAAATFALAEELMRNAFAEMEAHLLEQISSRLRAALPELIDSILREQLETEGNGGRPE